MSIGVPGELAGYVQAYKNFSTKTIPWKELFDGAIKVASEGFPVGAHMENAINVSYERIKKYEGMRLVATCMSQYPCNKSSIIQFTDTFLSFYYIKHSRHKLEMQFNVRL